jgi:GDP-L-fucose synthase
MVWGTGRPRRELLYSDDMAEACLFLLRLPDTEFAKLVAPATLPLVNIGTGVDHTIAELAKLVAEVVGFRGALRFDPSRPDGTPQKLLDVSRLARLGWKASTSLKEGTAFAYRDFLTSLHKVPA